MATISELSSMLQGGRDVDLPNGKRVTVQSATVSGTALSMNIVVTVAGHVQPFINPWIVINPPTQTAAGDTDAGAVFDEIVGDAGFFNA